MTITVEQYLNDVPKEVKERFLSQLNYRTLTAGDHYIQEGPILNFINTRSFTFQIEPEEEVGPQLQNWVINKRISKRTTSWPATRPTIKGN